MIIDGQISPVMHGDNDERPCGNFFDDKRLTTITDLKMLLMDLSGQTLKTFWKRCRTIIDVKDKGGLEFFWPDLSMQE